MEIFKGLNLLEFAERFKTSLDCKEYLARMKWKNHYCCRKCNNTSCQMLKNFSRTCIKCGDTKSLTANTIFHRVRFGFRTAFFIGFELATTTNSSSATQMGVRYGKTEKTARLFMIKVREAMASSENHPMNDNFQVDEFALGGYDEKKLGRNYDTRQKMAIAVVEFIDNGQVKRLYALNMKDFSAQSLQYMFIKHVDRNANATTYKWKGYKPIAKAYKINQIEINKGLNFKALHIMIHQIKSLIRTTYSWVSEFNLNQYLTSIVLE